MCDGSGTLLRVRQNVWVHHVLKFNRRFWDKSLVIEAHRNARNKKLTEHAAKLAKAVADKEATLGVTVEEQIPTLVFPC